MLSPENKYNNKVTQKNTGKYFFPVLVIFFVFGFFSGNTQTIFAATGINEQISFQGKVVNGNGTNVANASYNFLFCLYTTPTPSVACTAGANNDAVWRESKSLTVTDGIFQSNLGDTTTLPGSVDFNTDNIYLGINFNSDGQMSPLVRFTAAPYAMNAAKVGGLTVTDTTGTLTIPNGKTISFADAFSTSGAFPLTLTSTASTTATLPSGTITLVDLATSQSLTNKTIGSTGLTFSGATTDITTATGEDLTVVANGAGIINLNDSVTTGTLTISGAATDITTGSGESLVIVANGAGTVDIQDATTVDSLTADTGGVSIAAGQSYTGVGAVTLSSTTNGLTLDSGNNTLTIAATDTAISATGVTTLTLAPNVSITNATGNITLQPATSGTIANVQIGAGGAGSTTPDFFGLDVKSDTGDPAGGFEGAMYYNTLDNKFRCYQGAGWTDCIATGGSQTPWTSDISAAGYDLGSLSNLGFQETTGAPTGTDVGFYRDNSGDLTGNVLTGKTFNLAVNGTDEYNFSSTGLGFNSNAITSVGSISQVSGSSISETGSYSNTLDLYDGGGDVTLSFGGSGGRTLHVSGGVSASSGGYEYVIPLDVTGAYASTTAGTTYAGKFVYSDTGNVSSSTDTAYGNYVSVTRTGASGGTIDNYGQYITMTGDSGGASTNTGLAVTVAGADTNYAATFSGGAVGIGTTTPTALRLQIDDATYTAGATAAVAINLNSTGASSSGTYGGIRVDNTLGGNAYRSRYGVWASAIQNGVIGTTSGDSNSNIDLTAGWLTTPPSGLTGVTYGTTGGNALNGLSYTITSSDMMTLLQANSTFSGNGLKMNFGAGSGTFSGSFLRLQNNSADKFTIDSTGAVGIGADTTPDSPLEIVSTSQQLRLSYTDGSVDGLIYVDSNEYLTLQAGTSGEIKRVQIGAGGAGSTTPDYFGLDVKSDTGDPAGGFEGAMYYNTNDNVFRCYQNAGWTNCIGSQTPWTGNIDADNFTLTDLGTNITARAGLTIATTTTGILTLDSGTTGAINIGTGTAGKAIHIGDDDTTADTLTIGSAKDALTLRGTTITIGNIADTTVSIVDNNWSVTAAGAATFTSVGAGSGTITTSGTIGTAATTTFTGAGGTFSSALAANGGITFDAATDTIGAFTAAGNIDMNATYIITNIGSTATDFTTSGALTIGLDAAEANGALIVNNAAQANPIIVAQDNGTMVWQVGDNGLVTVDPATTGTVQSFALATQWTTGTVISAAFGGATTQSAGTMTGVAVDLNTNLTTPAAGQNVTGLDVKLPVASTTSNATVYTGFNLSTAGAVTNATAGSFAWRGANVAMPNITQSAGGSVTSSGVLITSGSITTGGTENMLSLAASGVGAGTLNAINVGTITGGAGAETAINVGSGWDTILGGTTAGTNLIGFTNFTVTTAGAGTFASTLNANGGIAFDAASDTVGAHTLSGTINANTNIIENIGNTGTDFVASTGALTLAGVLTANGGITLAGSQTFAASALSYMDLSAITHGTTANQGFRLPQAASASPSNPTGGLEGYLAWDAAGNQLITYNGSAWATIGGGGGYNLIKDETTSLTARTTLAFLGAGVTCADSGSQTECTISGGSGSDLQGTYGADADGSNATISLTAADDGLVFTNPTSGGNNLSTFLLQLDQAHTTDAINVLDIIQSSNAANAVNITANSIDTETGLLITANGLTSGKALNVTSSVASGFTGNLADISLTGSGASNTGNVLAISNTGTANANTTLFLDHRATGTGNLALRVNDESSDTTPFIIDGNGSVGIGTTSIASGGHGAGENLLQIGSATKRGNATLYGDLEMKGRILETALTNIVDTFIYDTATDSDGGAWTNSQTSQQLSWYTETKDDGIGDACSITTDDRCGDSYFPKKAIIVTTPSALYIFDAQDNSMFMKFDQNTSGSCVTGPCTLGADSNNNPSGVFAVNGVIYVGTNGSSGTGMYALDFVTDRLWRFNTTNRSLGDKSISARNTVVTYSANNTLMAIADNLVNDVHGAVIYGGSALQTSSGPLNGGLYVAAATDTGISVVSFSDRRTWDIADNAGDDYNAVYLTRRGRLYALNENTDNLERYGAQVAGGINIDWLFADTTAATPTWTYDDTATNRPNIGPATVAIGTSPDALDVVERGSLADEAADLIYVGTDQGLAEIHDVNIPAVNASMGWSKFYNTTRQTAYMSGNTDGMWMMDDASGDLVNSAPAATNNNLHNVVGTATYGANGVHGNAITLANNTMFCVDANTDNTCDNDTDYNYGDDSLTIELWFKHSTTAPAAGIDVLVSRRFTSANVYAGGYELWMTSTCTVSFAMDDDNTTWNDDGAQATTTQTYCDDQWHHLVATRLTTDGIINLSIDGKTISDAAVASAYADANTPMLTVGGDCSVGAACVTGANFWDGSIDDLVMSSGATATGDGTTHIQARKRFLEGKQALENKTISITDASSATSTTLTKTGQTWTLNEFVGQSVEIVSGTGANQTRKIVSNTADTLTVYPAFTSSPDTTSDFEVNAERLYGGTNTITAVAGFNGTFLGRSNQALIGASNGSDAGGVTRLSGINRGEANEYYHADAAIADDAGASWSGTDADDMTSIDARAGVVVMNSLATMWVEKTDREMENTLDTIQNDINSIKGELLVDTILGTSVESGQMGGADLAERYFSDETLEPGTVVVSDTRLTSGVKKSTLPYQRDLLGVVATQPGLILGESSDNSYPIALVGRVPVKVTTENGWPLAGERITASSVPGYAMRASQAGRVLGQVIEELTPGNFSGCPVEYGLPLGVQCGTVMIFVNLTDYYGQPVELAMAAWDETAKALEVARIDDTSGLAGENVSVRLVSTAPTREEKILEFLRAVRDTRMRTNMAPSEIFTDRLAASTEIITPKLVVDELFAKSIKAESIEGLAIWTDQIASLQEKYAGLQAENSTENPGNIPAIGAALRQLSVDSLTLQLDGSILGKLSVAGGLQIGGTAEFQGETLFAQLATFIGETVFRGKVSFEKTPNFGSDTAGFAVIEKGATKVRIIFDEPYEDQPIVAVSLTNNQSPLLNKEADSDLKADIALVEKEYLDTIFNSDVRYVVTEKDVTGFTIVLNQKAPSDFQFSWVALAVTDSHNFISEGEQDLLEEPVEPSQDENILPPPTTPNDSTGPFLEEVILPTEETLLEITTSDTDGGSEVLSHAVPESDIHTR